MLISGFSFSGKNPHFGVAPSTGERHRPASPGLPDLEHIPHRKRPRADRPTVTRCVCLWIIEYCLPAMFSQCKYPVSYIQILLI